MFYAVKVGRKPGIYNTWSECQAQTSGFSGAVFHKFKNIEEANNFMGDDNSNSSNNNNINSIKNFNSDCDLNYPLAFVDGSYNPKTKEYSYGIYFKMNEESEPIMFSGKDNIFYEMRNVSGECDAVIKAAKYAEKIGLKELNIYHDYNGVAFWYDGSWKGNSPVVINYKNNVKTLAIKLNFFKVPAHTGIYGNEMADKLAKEAVGIE